MGWIKPSHGLQEASLATQDRKEDGEVRSEELRHDFTILSLERKRTTEREKDSKCSRTVYLFPKGRSYKDGILRNFGRT